MDQIRKEKLKNAVRYFYDLQMLRMQSGNRATKKAELAQACLDEDDKSFLDRTGKGLNALERDALKEVARLLKGVSIWEDYLKDVRGIGPTLAGVIVAEINIEQCTTASKLWAWCGCHTQRFCADCDAAFYVVQHSDTKGPDVKIYKEPAHQDCVCPECGSDRFYRTSVKRVKGQKLTFNPWLKSKMLGVLGDCLLKSASLDDEGYHTKRPAKGPDGKTLYTDELDDEGNPTGKQKKVMERVPWPKGVPCFRKYYDDYKAKLERTSVSTCTGCNGTGKVTRVEREKVVDIGDKKPRKKAKCPNCDGTGGPAPKGSSAAHRHAMANRYMVKMFLLDLWREWRAMEGLEVRPSYAEEYLGMPVVSAHELLGATA